MDYPALQRLAPPGVTALVAFLAYSSQYLFCYIEPGSLRKGDAYIFNALVGCLLICYWRTCFTDPGRISQDWWERLRLSTGNESETDEQAPQRQRWCRKCETFKPPRAHHCKTCKRYVCTYLAICRCVPSRPTKSITRCITKMDHHCVWTGKASSSILFITSTGR